MKKTKKNFYSLIILLSSIIIFGCSQQSEISTSEATGESISRASCFNQRNINNYKILDRGNLIVYARPKSRAYHLQVSPPSLDVRGMDMISFQSWSGRVCGYAGDELIVPDSLFQGRFSITSVTELNEASLYNLLVRFGKADALETIEPENEKPPEITRELEDNINKDKEEAND